MSNNGKSWESNAIIKALTVDVGQTAQSIVHITAQGSCVTSRHVWGVFLELFASGISQRGGTTASTAMLTACSSHQDSAMTYLERCKE